MKPKSFILIMLCLSSFIGCQSGSLNKSEVSGKYSVISPGYITLAKYVISEGIVGYRLGQRKLIFNQDNSFLMVAGKRDTIAGTWTITPEHKIRTTVTHNDSTYHNTYTSKGNKLYITYISFRCEDTARIKPRKLLVAYEKMED